MYSNSLILRICMTEKPFVHKKAFVDVEMNNDDDSGNNLSVDSLVKEFLDTNPHFRAAGASTTNTKTNVSNGSSTDFDLASLDLTKPEHRQMYKEARQKGLL